MAHYDTNEGEVLTSVKRYVLGFVFSCDRKLVALIRKTKPVWQSGLLNGVGGKVEHNESPLRAMQRECKEEFGIFVPYDYWLYYANMHGERYDYNSEPFHVDCFVTVVQDYVFSSIKSTSGEEVQIISLESLHKWKDQLIGNLQWLIFLALDCTRDNRPSFIDVKY